MSNIIHGYLAFHSRNELKCFRKLIAPDAGSSAGNELCSWLNNAEQEVFYQVECRRQAILEQMWKHAVTCLME